MTFRRGLAFTIFLISFTTAAIECPEGACEDCSLMMSVSLNSVNNEITVTPQDEITFTVIFQRQGHNAFTFKVNDKIFNPNIRDSDFMCTSESDVQNLTLTLKVRYHCIAVEPGSYRIQAYVYYCNRDYFTQNVTVIVENDLPTLSASSASSTSTLPSPSQPSILSTSIPSSMSPSVVPSTISVPLSASSSSIITNTSMTMSPSSTTDSDDMINDHETGANTSVLLVICIFTGSILVVILIITVILVLLLMYIKRRCKNVSCGQSEQPTPDSLGDYPMQQTHHGSNTAVSETSNTTSGNYTATSDFSAPVESMSVSLVQPEQAVLSEPATQDPCEDTTPHQCGSDSHWGTNH